MTTKNLALAASIMMLATISGQALAGTDAPKAQYWRTAAGRSNHQAVRAFNAIDPPMATQTIEPNAHRLIQPITLRVVYWSLAPVEFV